MSWRDKSEEAITAAVGGEPAKAAAEEPPLPKAKEDPAWHADADERIAEALGKTEPETEKKDEPVEPTTEDEAVPTPSPLEEKLAAALARIDQLEHVARETPGIRSRVDAIAAERAQADEAQRASEIKRVKEIEAQAEADDDWKLVLKARDRRHELELAQREASWRKEEAERRSKAEDPNAVAVRAFVAEAKINTAEEYDAVVAAEAMMVMRDRAQARASGRPAQFEYLPQRQRWEAAAKLAQVGRYAGAAQEPVTPSATQQGQRQPPKVPSVAGGASGRGTSGLQPTDTERDTLRRYLGARYNKDAEQRVLRDIRSGTRGGRQ